MVKRILECLTRLTCAIEASTLERKTEFDYLRSQAGLATRQDLERMEKNIMSKIAEFAAAQKAFNDRQDTAIDDLTGDVQTLNDKIAALQNSAGEITPEDQALLDDLQAHAATVTTKLEALDALTPPAIPAA